MPDDRPLLAQLYREAAFFHLSEMQKAIEEEKVGAFAVVSYYIFLSFLKYVFFLTSLILMIYVALYFTAAIEIICRSTEKC